MENYLDFSLENIIDCLLQNRSLVKDSGLWRIEIYGDIDTFNQKVDETFKNFIYRYVKHIYDKEPFNYEQFIIDASLK